jgi:hypothetical protein
MGNTTNLLIPGKNTDRAHQGYTKDMQTVEIWSRQPIQQLVAGSGITLSPASGLATDSKGNGPNPITITATGGGGGGYASLTGPGQTVTPGDLTQAGGFTVNDTAGDGINFTSTGGAASLTSSSGNVTVGSGTGLSALQGSGTVTVENLGTSAALSAPAAGGMTMVGGSPGSGEVQVTGAGGNQVVITGGSAGNEITLNSGGQMSLIVPGGVALSLVGGSTHTGMLVGNSGANPAISFYGHAIQTQQAGAGITTVAQLVTALQNLGLLS